MTKTAAVKPAETKAKPETDKTTATDAALTPAFTHRISGTPEHGFYRAGRHWPREGVEVNQTDFTADQWAVLEAEPRLAIVAL